MTPPINQARRVGWIAQATWLLLLGCSSLRIDPSGERLFVTETPGVTAAPAASSTAPPVPQQPGIVLTPPRVIAPVGGDVIVVATVFGRNGLPQRDRQVEWILSPDSVGYILTPRGFVSSYSLGFYPDPPHKITNSYALGKTLGRAIQVTRGNSQPADDVLVGVGQAWLTLSSPTEGSTYVTAYAPQVENWDRRASSAIIHWVDARWTPPPSSANAVGTRDLLTTTVVRASDGTPVQGWEVRYEVVSGPAAGFAPEGASSVSVRTDASGQGSAELYQLAPQPGSNQIRVELVRPAGVSFSEQQPLLIGSTTIERTWSAPDIALQMAGPSQGGVASPLLYRITVSNPGELVTRGVVVTSEIPPGMTFVSSVPEAAQQGSMLQWSLGDLQAKQNATVEVTLRAEAAASVNFCASVASSEGLGARDCVATTVTAVSVDVAIQGPERAAVGAELSYTITVRNRGQMATLDLLLVDRFDDGLEFLAQGQRTPSPIETDVAAIPPGGSRAVEVRFRGAREGRFCQMVEVQDKADTTRKYASAQHCVEVVAVAAQQPVVSVTKSGPASRVVGEVARFESVVRNDGPIAVYGLQVYDEYDDALLRPAQATPGFAATGELIWTIDALLPGQSRTFVVECDCLNPATNVCSPVTVTGPANLRATAEACLNILPAGAPAAAGPSTSPPAGGAQRRGSEPAGSSTGGNLSLTVVDQQDPIQRGDSVNYYITVTNLGQTPEYNVSLVVTLPGNLTLDRVISNMGTRLLSQEGGVLRFEAIRELRRAGDSVRYGLVLRSTSAGPAEVLASVTSQATPKPVQARQTTNVLPSSP